MRKQAKRNALDILIRLWRKFYGRWVLWHINRDQSIRLAGLHLTVPAGVFHPVLFFSTPIFLDFLRKIDFKGKKVLDVGTGSGALALFAAQNGGIASGIDISPLAVRAATENAAQNALNAAFHVSNLFQTVPPTTQFDFVLVNPPYYPSEPDSLPDHAFYAGKNFDYFERFFGQLKPHIHAQSKVWMVLSANCDTGAILGIAQSNDFDLKVVFEKVKWGERFQIFECDNLGM